MKGCCEACGERTEIYDLKLCYWCYQDVYDQQQEEEK